MLTQTIVRGSLAGVLLASLTLPTNAQSTQHVDEANHFEAQVPEGWYPIRQSLLDAARSQMEKRIPNKRLRRVGGYSMSPEGELTLPYVAFLVRDGPMNRATEAELVAAFKAKSWKGEVLARAEVLSDIQADLDLDAIWDPVARQLIIPMTAELYRIGPIRGIGVARVASHGLVQINCYARASEFDATMPAFQEWIDGVEIDPDYQWRPGSEGGIDWRQVGWTGLIGGIASALGALIYMRLRRSPT